MKALIHAKEGNFLVEKRFGKFDLIHDAGVFKYQGKDDKVKEIAHLKNKLEVVQARGFIPTVGIVRVHQGDKIIDTLVRYPFNRMERTAQVIGVGTERENGEPLYEEVFKDKSPEDVRLSEGITYKALKNLYVEAKEDPDHPLAYLAKEAFNVEKTLEALKNLYRENPREFKMVLKPYVQAGLAEIKSEEDIKLAKTLRDELIELKKNYLRGNEKVEFIPLNGIVVGNAIFKNPLTAISFFPSRIPTVPTTYLAKTMNTSNRDYARILAAVNLLSPERIRKIEKLEGKERQEYLSFLHAKVEKLSKGITDEEVKKNFEYLLNALKDGDINRIKFNVNLLSEKADRTFEETIEKENLVRDNLVARGKEGYFLRNSVANIGMTLNFAKKLFEEIGYKMTKEEYEKLQKEEYTKEVYVLSVPTPRIIENKQEKTFEIKQDVKPYMFVSVVKDKEGNILGYENVEVTPADRNTRSAESRLYGLLKFIRDRANSDEQAKALIGKGLGDGEKGVKGLETLKAEFAQRKIMTNYVAFTEYLQRKLLEAGSLEGIKEVIESDPVIGDFMRKMETYFEGRKIVQKAVEDEQILGVIFDKLQPVIEKLHQEEEGKEVAANTAYVAKSLREASWGRVRYKVEPIKKVEKPIDIEKEAEELAQLLAEFEEEAVSAPSEEVDTLAQIDSASEEEAVFEEESEMDVLKDLDYGFEL